MISIRISDQEYREIKARCTDFGDLNVSEFVRAAMMCALASSNSDSPPSFLDLKVASLYNRMEKLERKLEEVAAQAGIRGIITPV